jgi:hypothetical protein
MSLKKILGWAAVIAAAYYVFKSPVGATGSIRDVFHALIQAGHGLARFLTVQ